MDLAATMTPDPFPNWRPGRPGLTAAHIDQWVNWYIGGLDNVTSWQMHILSSLGYAGYYQLVTPGSGTRPDDLSAEERQNLPDGTTGVGAVWNRYYALLPDKANVVAYVSSVADDSGDDDSCQPGDDLLPLTSSVMDSWSATRWISRIATGEGLPVAGENPGYSMRVSLDLQYTNTGPAGRVQHLAISPGGEPDRPEIRQGEIGGNSGEVCSGRLADRRTEYEISLA